MEQKLLKTLIFTLIFGKIHNLLSDHQVDRAALDNMNDNDDDY